MKGMTATEIRNLFSGPLLIEPELMRAMLLPLLAGGEVCAAAQADEEAARQARAARLGEQAKVGAVAVVPIYGMITPRDSWVSRLTGWSTAEGIVALARQAAADSSVKAILYDVDSPGGLSAGLAEATDALYALRGSKPSVAISRHLNASAAYHLSSAADYMVGAPGSETGSIGVWLAHMDESEAIKAEGLKITLVKAGRYKVEANPFEPLSDEAHAFLQSLVDDSYASFVAAVARNRGITATAVRDGYGEGRVLRDRKALAAGLIDKVASLEETLARMSVRRLSRSAPAAELFADEWAQGMQQEETAQVDQDDDTGAALAREQEEIAIRLRLAEVA